MSTGGILLAGVGGVMTLTAVPLAVYAVAGPRNTRRDRREDREVQAFTERVTKGLLAQVADADDATANVGNDPDRLAHAAWRHTAAVHRHLYDTGQDTTHVDRALDLIGDLFDGHAETFGTVCPTPLANLIAADLLLHRLARTFTRGTHARATAHAASGALANAGFGVPNSRILGNRLTEHGPAPMHHAHAAWLDLAYKAGILEANVEPVFNGDVMRPPAVPVYPPGHRLAHTNGMDVAAALGGAS